MTVQASPQTNAFPQWLAEHGAEPAAIFSFCLRRGLLAHVQTAVELVSKHFPNFERLQIRLERDPEVEGESIVLDLGVRDEVDSFLENYDRCKEAWVAAIPGLELSSICLVYSLR